MGVEYWRGAGIVGARYRVQEGLPREEGTRRRVEEGKMGYVVGQSDA